MAIQKIFLAINDLFKGEEIPLSKPLHYRGFAKDYASFQKDRNAMAKDMHYAWDKTKRQYQLERYL